jgi:hypothetical protein
MPEHGQPQTSIAVSGAAAESCPLATIRTPAPLAIPELANQLETAVRLNSHFQSAPRRPYSNWPYR